MTGSSKVSVRISADAMEGVSRALASVVAPQVTEMLERFGQQLAGAGLGSHAARQLGESLRASNAFDVGRFALVYGASNAMAQHFDQILEPMKAWARTPAHPYAGNIAEQISRAFQPPTLAGLSFGDFEPSVFTAPDLEPVDSMPPEQADQELVKDLGVSPTLLPFVLLWLAFGLQLIAIYEAQRAGDDVAAFSYLPPMLVAAIVLADRHAGR